MKEGYGNQKLIYEEKKAIKLFLWLFYITFFSYDIFYHFVYPKFSKSNITDILKEGLGYWYYILILLALPLAIYLIKKGNPYVVKYIYIYWYILIDIIDGLLTYLGTDKPYASGNIVEVLFILFSPIFVNKKFFWTVTLGLIGKDLLLGVILQDINVLFPVIIFTILSSIASIILIRFNSYIDALTTVYDELRQKEKLAVIGQMAAAIGHEIRNPLSSLKGFTQLQKERYPNTNDYYPIMIQEIDRINSIVNDLMYLGKPKVIEFKNSNIEEIIAYTLSITQQQAERQLVVFETLIEGPLPSIKCDAKQLKQVFINLFKNAIEAMMEGGKIKVNVKLLKGQEMYISIQDEGCGIAEEDILNLGEPFYTTKKDGTGLGLMVSNQIIKDHKGTLKIRNNQQKGTMVEVVLPLF
ncbi:ATP-binding protein [Neobacillus niacini]|uniref:ATP-binding protein n=1 Tax=Neobacillus niacini TaxID=86668 RepID=UPI0028661247|nr:ATP-binding protein [Neobacillus niacini]MDR7002424.1 signal transduction histidine kinase [Neobacillus niacini]